MFRAGICAVLFLVQAQAASASNQLFENSIHSPLIDLIQGAKQSIDVEIYTMNDDQVRNELQNALERGVKLRIVQEPAPVGVSCRIFGSPASKDNALCTAERDFKDYVVSNGGEYVPFNKGLCGTPNSNCFEHGKIVIVDGSQIMLSTGNFDPTSICDAAANPANCNRDYSVVTDQFTVVQQLSTIFENDLKGVASDLTNLDPSINVSPNSMTPILNFIKSAQKTLILENQYLQDTTMNQALVDAAKRGVAIKVMVASACSYGTPSKSDSSKWQKNYSTFETAGIESRAFTGTQTINGFKGYLHAKAMVADGVRAWVGSVNGSTTAISDNREFGLFFNDADLVAQLNDYLTSDFNDPNSETWQESLTCAKDY